MAAKKVGKAKRSGSRTIKDLAARTSHHVTGGKKTRAEIAKLEAAVLKDKEVTPEEHQQIHST